MVDKVTKMAAELIFSVNTHTSLTHSGGKPYECDQCKYSSKRAQNLKPHKLTHSGEKPYACDQCKYSSKTAQNLKTHKLTHSGEKPYACDQCKYSSKMAQNLKTHKLTHSGEKPYAGPSLLEFRIISSLSACSVRGQARILLGRLDLMGSRCRATVA